MMNREIDNINSICNIADDLYEMLNQTFNTIVSVQEIKECDDLALRKLLQRRWNLP